MSSNTIIIKKLANRLENASSMHDRLSALVELQNLSKVENNAMEIGTYALQIVLDQLMHCDTSEEYVEILDLMEKLINSKNKEANIKNSKSILSESRNVETLLELMCHENGTTSIIASQVLTLLHGNDGEFLEKSIQQCPNGLNRLLERLSDSSREEVRNQSIVLIQELTISNESMKNALVFQEGFDILFATMREEGGSRDCGVVVQDCLMILRNILYNSKISQEFFYSMHSKHIANLIEYFDPLLLEGKLEEDGYSNPVDTPNKRMRSKFNNENTESYLWFEHIHIFKCTLLSLTAITASMGVERSNNNYQNKLFNEFPSLSTSLCSYLVRRGPIELFLPIFSCLSRMLRGNSRIAYSLHESVVKHYVSEVGVNIPPLGCSNGAANGDGEVSVIQGSNAHKYDFGSEITESVTDAYGHGGAPSRYHIITLSGLLCDTYIHGGTYWSAFNDDGSGAQPFCQIYENTMFLPVSRLDCMVTGDGLCNSIGNNANGSINTSVILDDFLCWILDIAEDAGAGTDCTPIEDSCAATLDTVSKFLNHPNSEVPFSILTYDGEYINISNICLQLLDGLLSADSTIGMMMLQHIVAPPPPPPTDDSELGSDVRHSTSKINDKAGNNAFEPLGLLLFNTVISQVGVLLKEETGGVEDVTQRESEHKNADILTLMQKQLQKHVNASGTAPKYSKQIAFALRAVNILTMVFVRGDEITTELGIRIQTKHTCLHEVFPNNSGNSNSSSPLFVYILNTMIPQLLMIPDADPLVAALFRLLTSSVKNCVNAVKVLLESPDSEYMYDLLSPSSDHYGGLDHSLQASVALFLGTCVHTLPKTSSTLEEPDPVDELGTSDGSISRLRILSMIEQRVGVARYMDLLQRPIASGFNNNNYISKQCYNRSNNHHANSKPNHEAVRNSAIEMTPASWIWYFCTGYKKYYIELLDSIKLMMLGIYTNSSVMNGSSGSHDGFKYLTDSKKNNLNDNQIIVAQKQKIIELEKQLQEKHGTLASVDHVEVGVESSNVKEPHAHSMVYIKQIQDLELHILDLEQKIEKSELERKLSTNNDLGAVVDEQTKQIELLNLQIVSLETEKANHFQQSNPNVVNSVGSFTMEFGELSLKYTQLLKQNEKLIQEMSSKDRKISLYEDEMKGPVPFERMREQRISDLEVELQNMTEDLKQMELNCIETNREYAKLIKSIVPMCSFSNINIPSDIYSKYQLDDPNYMIVEKASRQDILQTLNDIAYTCHVLSDCVLDTTDVLHSVVTHVNDMWVQERQEMSGNSLIESDQMLNSKHLENCLNDFMSWMNALKEKNGNNTGSQSEMTDTNLQIQNLEADLTEYINYAKQLEDQNNELIESVEKLSVQVANGNSHLNDDSELSLKVSELEDRLLNSAAEHEQARATVSELESKVSELEDRLLNSAAEHEQAQATVSELESKVSEQSAQLLELQYEVESAGANAESNVDQERMAALETDLTEYINYAKQLEDQNNELHSIVENLQAERDALNTQIGDISCQKTDTEAKAEGEATAQSEESVSPDCNVEGGTQEPSQLDVDVEELQKEVESKRCEVLSLRAVMQEKNQIELDLKKEIEDLKSVIDEHQSTIHTLEAECDMNCKELKMEHESALQQMQVDVDIQVNEYESRLSALTQDIDVKTQEIEALNTNCTANQERMAALETDLTEYINYAKQLEDQNNELIEATQKYESRISDLDIELAVLKQDSDEEVSKLQLLHANERERCNELTIKWKQLEDMAEKTEEKHAEEMHALQLKMDGVIEVSNEHFMIKLNDELDSLRAEHDQELERVVSEAVNESERKAQMLSSEYDLKVAELESLVSEQSAQLLDLQNEMESARANAESNVDQERMAALETDLTEYINYAKQLEDQNNEYAMQKAEYDEIISKLENEIITNKSNADIAMDSLLKKYEFEVDCLKKEISLSQESKVISDSQGENLNESASRSTNTVHIEFNNLKQSYNELEDVNKQLHVEIDHLRNQLVQYKQKSNVSNGSSLEDKNKKLEQQVVNYSESVQKLKNQIKSLEASVAEFKRREQDRNDTFEHLQAQQTSAEKETKLSLELQDMKDRHDVEIGTLQQTIKTLMNDSEKQHKEIKKSYLIIQKYITNNHTLEAHDSFANETLEKVLILEHKIKYMSRCIVKLQKKSNGVINNQESAEHSKKALSQALLLARDIKRKIIVADANPFSVSGAGCSVQSNEKSGLYDILLEINAYLLSNAATAGVVGSTPLKSLPSGLTTPPKPTVNPATPPQSQPPQSWHTPVITGTSTVSGNQSTISKEIIRMRNALMKEKQQYTLLYEEHSDLLELLAQQEMELEEYKQSLIKVCQKRTKSKMEDGLNGFNVDELISSIKHKVEEKYGSYIEFR